MITDAFSFDLSMSLQVPFVPGLDAPDMGTGPILRLDGAAMNDASDRTATGGLVANPATSAQNDQPSGEPTLAELSIEEVLGVSDGFREHRGFLTEEEEEEIIITGQRIGEDASPWIDFWMSNGDACDSPDWFRDILDQMNDGWAETDAERAEREAAEQKAADEARLHADFEEADPPRYFGEDKDGNPINAWYEGGVLWVDSDKNGKVDHVYTQRSDGQIGVSTDGASFSPSDNPLNSDFPSF